MKQMETEELAKTVGEEANMSVRRNASESFANVAKFWSPRRPWRKRSKSSDHIQLLQHDNDCDNDNCEHTYQDYFKSGSYRTAEGKLTTLYRRNVLRPAQLLWPGGQRAFQRRGKRDCPSSTSPSNQQQQVRSWLIPAEHPCKILWDILTVIISCYYAYATHTAIRDRKFGWQHSSFFVFSEIWFFIDILLNFVTERKISNYVVLRDTKKVWARYLTTWFAVDVLSLVPWEALYVQPIIEQQNRRSIWKKTLFRSRAVLRFCRRLGGRHFKLFGQVAKHSKLHAGVGALRLIRLMIKYVPKYLLFFRNMKAVVAVRALRQVHWLRKVWRHNPTLFWKQRQRSDPCKDDAETSSIVTEFDDDELDGMSWWDESMSEVDRSTRMRTLVRVVGYDAKLLASKKQAVVEDNGWSEDDDPY